MWLGSDLFQLPSLPVYVGLQVYADLSKLNSLLMRPSMWLAWPGWLFEGERGHSTGIRTRNDRNESDRNAQSHSKVSTNNAAPEQSPMTWSNSMGCTPAAVILDGAEVLTCYLSAFLSLQACHRADRDVHLNW